MAAQRIVVARLEVDEKGVVKSVKKVGTEVDKMATKTSAAGQKMQTQMTKSSGAITKNMNLMARSMFSVSSAATALFSIGLLVGMFSRLVGELISSTEWFKSIKESATDFFFVMTEGEGTLDRAIRKLGDLSTAASFSSAFATLGDQIRALVTLREGLVDEFVRLNNIGLDLAAPAQLQAIEFDIKAINLRINEMGQAFLDAGINSNQFFSAFGANIQRIKPDLEEFLTFTGTVDIFAEMGTRGMRNFIQATTEAASIIEENIGDINDALGSTVDLMQSVSVAGAIAGAALAQAFLEGGTSLREALERVFKQVSTAMFIKAGENFALGLAASTPWGAATLGAPGPYFKAAAAFAGVGAAAGAGGIALGGRGSGGSGIEGGQFGSDLGQFPQSRSQTINITLEGGVFFGENRAKVARELAADIRDALGDNA